MTAPRPAPSAPSPAVRWLPPWLRVLVLLAVVQLSVMGIFGSVVRIAEVAEFLRAPIAGGEVSSANELRIGMIAQQIGITADSSPRYQQIETDLVGMSEYLNRRWLMTLVHCVFGTLFLLLTPLCIIERIRARNIELHRWLGRITLLSALVIGVSGLAFGFTAYAGTAEAIPAVLFGSFFLVAAERGYRAIRSAQVARHREWMIRLYAVGLGISAIRLVEGLLLATTQMRPLEMLAPAFWLGWTVTLLVTEIGIRWTRPKAPQGVAVTR